MNGKADSCRRGSVYTVTSLLLPGARRQFMKLSSRGAASIAFGYADQYANIESKQVSSLR